MEKETFGSKIAALRKEKGMTQLELAEKMGVTDKAVSKWERDLSYPDISTFPKLAEIFNVTTNELMQVEAGKGKNAANKKISQIVDLILKGIPLAMGIAVVVLSFISELKTNEAITMLGIGLACLAITQFSQKEA